MNPTWVDLKGVDSVPETVHHVVYRVDPAHDSILLEQAVTPSITDGVYDPTLGGIIQKDILSESIKAIKQQVLLKIIDKFNMSQCMIFCRTNVDCDNLETFLCNVGGGRKFIEKQESGKEHQYSCCVLGGMRSMQERRRNLDAFRDGSVRFLICTDVAARGIDIQGLPYMINMTLPDEPEHYIHRIGRVGRADRMGLAISIVATDDIQEKVWYHTCGNRGKGCFNRKLKQDGGCTIWYNESSILQAVKTRLHMDDIPMLKSTFDLPPELAAHGVVYGEEASSATTTTGNSEHLKSIVATVKELAAMEFDAQNIFLTFQSQFLRTV